MEEQETQYEDYLEWVKTQDISEILDIVEKHFRDIHKVGKKKAKEFIAEDLANYYEEYLFNHYKGE